MKKSIYLDYAAATPLDPRVQKTMQPYFADHFYNPSAIYLAARSVSKDLEEARTKIARTLGSRPGEIFFTAGATEANNLAISGLMSEYPKAQLIVSSVEHDSVLEPGVRYGAKIAPVDRNGVVKLDHLQKLITKRTVLVSIMLVNNELGTIQPIRKVAELIARVRRDRLETGNKLPIYLHTDAAQAANWLDLHVSRLGVDLMSVNGGKIYGPKQTGILYIKAGVKVQPIIVGGGQEHGMRSGTENVAGFIGLARALELAQGDREHESKKVLNLSGQFIDQLKKSLPMAFVNSPAKSVAPHIVSVSFPGVDNERLMMQLDEVGVQAAVGSACSAGSGESSHVLKAVGLTDKEIRSTVRFSFGRQTKSKDIKQTIKLLEKLVR